MPQVALEISNPQIPTHYWFIKLCPFYCIPNGMSVVYFSKRFTESINVILFFLIRITQWGISSLVCATEMTTVTQLFLCLFGHQPPLVYSLTRNGKDLQKPVTDSWESFCKHSLVLWGVRYFHTLLTHICTGDGFGFCVFSSKPQSLVKFLSVFAI